MGKRLGIEKKDVNMATKNKTALPSPEEVAELATELASSLEDERPVGTKFQIETEDSNTIRSAISDVAAVFNRLGAHEAAYTVQKNALMAQLAEAVKARDAAIGAVATKNKINIFDKSKGVWDVDLESMTFTRTA
jgi:hypothetical protein